jgi:predicted N-acetyltransferase YhbS
VESGAEIADVLSLSRSAFSVSALRDGLVAFDTQSTAEEFAAALREEGHADTVMVVAAASSEVLHAILQLAA